MQTYNDILGQEIGVGDIVAFAVQTSNYSTIDLATVNSIDNGMAECTVLKSATRKPGYKTSYYLKYDPLVIQKFDKFNLFGKRIVFTGRMKGGTRVWAEGTARKIGAIPQSEIKFDTNFLVVADNSVNSSKKRAAQRKGITVLSETEWDEILKKKGVA